MRLANMQQRLQLLEERQAIQLQRQALLDELAVLDVLDEVSYKAILVRVMFLDQEIAPHWTAAWGGSPWA